MNAPFGPRSESCFYVAGDVQIHPSAAIASGVLLQADKGSRLVIGPGVSVGSGAVVHAQGGVLSIAAQVTLGTGVLIMGRGRVGADACIGSKATLLVDVAVEPGQMIAANAILGHEALFSAGGPNAGSVASQNGAPAGSGDGQSDGEVSAPGPETAVETTQVYGKVVVQRLLRMMSASPPDPS
ncbi:MAG: hypothetical protein AAF289_04805 [Cyanobacteria bacterium P01_A01_bin.135]